MRTHPTRRNDLVAYLYVLPLFLFVTLFIAWSIGRNFWVGLHAWNGLDPVMTFVGLGNYATILRDGIFYRVLFNFAAFLVLFLPLQMLCGLLLATLCVSGIPRAVSSLAKTIMFLPVVTPPVAMGCVFSYSFFEYNYGIINTVLKSVGLSSLRQIWLGDPDWALLSCIAVFLWNWIGFAMLMYVAGLVAIPDEILDAASIDGANGRVRLFRIVVPMLKSTHASLTILGAIGCLKIYDVIYILTRGGPNNTTQSFSTYLLDKSLVQYQQGYGSALSVILFLFALALTAVQLRFYRGKEARHAR